MDKEIDQQTQTELEAAAFRTLVDHLRERTDVQNIDLMNLAGFCRNCLSKWYTAAASEKDWSSNTKKRARLSTECLMTIGKINIRKKPRRIRPPSSKRLIRTIDPKALIAT